MKRLMISLIIGSCMLGVTEGTAMAETVNFDQDKAGALPAGWKCGATGRGSPKWTVEKDDTAPTSPNVLKQSGSGTFPWCVKSDTSIENGTVEVKFKPISGREDAADVDAPVAKNQWHTLRVEFASKRIRVALDGKVYISQEDDHLRGPGAVGVWTKADSVTAFDDFAYSSAASR